MVLLFSTEVSLVAGGGVETDWAGAFRVASISAKTCWVALFKSAAGCEETKWMAGFGGVSLGAGDSESVLVTDAAAGGSGGGCGNEGVTAA